MSRNLLLRCLECLFPKAHEEDHAEYANAVKSKTKHLLTGATHYPNFARPKPYVVKDKKTGANPTQSDIDAKRLEFWASAPSSGGDREIWGVLKQASEAMLPKWETRDGTRVKMPGDLVLAHSMVLQHPIVVAKPDMTLCVDLRGFNYVLPKYILRDPLNLEDHSRGNPTGAIVTARRRAGAVDEDDGNGDSSSGDEGGFKLPAPPSRDAGDSSGDDYSGGLPPHRPGAGAAADAHGASERRRRVGRREEEVRGAAHDEQPDGVMNERRQRMVDAISKARLNARRVELSTRHLY